MSGSAGIRGYYYQILAGLLDSVEEDSWETIKIEPSTEGDKVDIEWVCADSIRAVQVKSSINNFERSMVINWVYTLVKDARSAYGMFELPITYTLYLIGTTDNNADKWISSLHGGRLKIEDDDKLKVIESELSQVEVKKQSFDLKHLEALAYVGMQEYLERNGKEAKLENIKTLCSVIVSELLKFTMQGRPMTKALFLQLINKHVNSGEYGITPIVKAIPELSLAFYEKEKVPESDEMFGIQLENTPLLTMFRSEAVEDLQKVKVIKLPMPEQEEKKSSQENNNETTHTNIEEIEADKVIQASPKSIKEILDPDGKMISELFNSGKTITELFNESSLSDLIAKDGYIPVRIPDKDIVELKELSKNILGIELTDEDFYFGDLKKRAFPTQRMFGGPVNIPKGTEDEIAKYYAIENAHASLLSYHYILEYSEYLGKCYPLPIILKNTGPVADEEIQVTLKFPLTAQVVTPLRMEAPLEPFIKDFITDNSVFDNLITPARDHTIMEYEGTRLQMPVLPKMHMHYERVSYTPKDFANHLAYLFNYEYFQEGGCDIIQYEFKALNPSRCMAFPTFLLVQSDDDIHIEYTIASKYLSKPIEGTLHWFHPDNTSKNNS